MQDVLAAVQFVRGNAKEFRIAPERVGIFGHSAGGNLGALAALGAHSRAVLGELGYAAAEIDALAADGAIRTS